MIPPGLVPHILTDPSEVSEFWGWLTMPGRKYVACDTETSGLDFWAPGFRVRMIQFGDSSGGWAIPFEGWRTLITDALAWCAKARVTTVWWNLAYDALALRSQGIELDYSIQADGMVLAALGGYTEQSKALKPCAVREFGNWAGVGASHLHATMSARGWTWDTVPFGWLPYPLYGVMDTCITGMLWERYADRYETWRDLHDLEVAAIDLTGQMSWRGLPVDKPYLAGKVKEFGDEEDALISQIRGYGIKNPAQNAAVALKLKEAGVLDETRLTPGGKVSVDSATLDLIDHPIARIVTRWRWVHRVKGTYLEPLLNGADANSRVHMDIRPMEARTSRMSISSPPLQQLPSGPEVRRGVVSLNPGDDVVISADYSQIELRLWASMTGDKALLDAIKASDAPDAPDFFTQLCQRIYNEPGFVKSDHRRTQVKSSTYAKLFGGGIEVAAGTAGVHPYAMTDTWRMLGDTFTSLGGSTPGEVMIEHGDGFWFGQSPMGRRFAVKDRNERRKIPNYMTQGTSAIALKRAMVGMRAAGLGPNMLLPVHDEILLSAPKKDLDEIKHTAEEVMMAVINPEEWGIAVPVDAGVGETWAEAH